MAARTRAFVRAVFIDAWLLSLVVFASLLRVANHLDARELVPFVLHAPHIATLAVGVPGTHLLHNRFAPTLLRWVMPATILSDIVACVWHLNALSHEIVGHHTHDSKTFGECTLLALLSAALAASAANLALAASAFLAAFGTMFVAGAPTLRR